MSKYNHRQVAQFYDEVYHRNAETASHHSRHLRRLARRLRIAKGEKLLDIACGTGKWLAAAAQRGAEISGIDISQRAIQICRQSLPSGTFHVGIAERLPFDEHEFDLVTCLGSLEHFLDQAAALREMARVAKLDARLLILVPNAGFLTYRAGLYHGTQQQAIRETLYSLDEWQRMFREAGLCVIDRWKDLHVLDKHWVMRPPTFMAPLRFAQALALAIWPLNWQYQVYHLCRVR